jgi:hypothetical protein
MKTLALAIPPVRAGAAQTVDDPTSTPGIIGGRDPAAVQSGC